MQTRDIVAYYRVSTKLQGFGGLGMAAQRHAVECFATRNESRIIGAYEEVETGSKDHLRNRPELTRALAHAKRSRAVLVIARLDRLSRSVFVTAQLHQSNVDFVACDNPHANRLTIQILAVLAEHESRMTSARVKAAFAVRKAEGKSLKPTYPLSAENRRKGQAAAAIANRQRARDECADLLPILRSVARSGSSLQTIADRLNALGHTNRRGNPWSKSNVHKLFERSDIFRTPAPHRPIPPVVQAIGVRAAVARRKAQIQPVLGAIVRGLQDHKSFRAIARELNHSGSSTKIGTPWNTGSLSGLASRNGIDYEPRRRAIPNRTAERKPCASNAVARIAAADYYSTVVPLITRLRSAGYSHRRIAETLNAFAYLTSSGGSWLAITVWRVLKRASQLSAVESKPKLNEAK